MTMTFNMLSGGSKGFPRYVLFQDQSSVAVHTQTKIQLLTVESFGLVTGHQTASILLLAVGTKRYLI